MPVGVGQRFVRRDKIDHPFPNEHTHPAALLPACRVAGVEHPAVGTDDGQLAPLVEGVQNAAGQGHVSPAGRPLGGNVEQQQPAGCQDGEQKPAQPQPAPATPRRHQQKNRQHRQANHAAEEGKGDGRAGRLTDDRAEKQRHQCRGQKEESRQQFARPVAALPAGGVAQRDEQHQRERKQAHGQTDQRAAAA